MKHTFIALVPRTSETVKGQSIRIRRALGTGAASPWKITVAAVETRERVVGTQETLDEHGAVHRADIKKPYLAVTLHIEHHKAPKPHAITGHLASVLLQNDIALEDS